MGRRWCKHKRVPAPNTDNSGMPQLFHIREMVFNGCSIHTMEYQTATGSMLEDRLLHL